MRALNEIELLSQQFFYAISANSSLTFLVIVQVRANLVVYSIGEAVHTRNIESLCTNISTTMIF
jgi:hypothetical protein